MEFYYIRHAQSTNNALWSKTHSDAKRVAAPELTDIGRQQAQILGEFLQKKPPHTEANGADSLIQNINGFSFTHLYSSLMIRAMDTAAAIADKMDIQPQIWVDIHECGGMWLSNPETGQREGKAGANRAFFEARYPQFVLPADLGEAGWWNKPHESIEDLPARGARVVETLLAKHNNSNNRVAVVSHGAFFNVFLHEAIGIPVHGNWFSLNNASISRLDFIDGVIRPRYINRVDFLPAHLIT